ncbi:tpr repeat-containing protein [Anaeramoeba flamelloides]|uniref:Tpr repeat-containing protein n=1 Tax=Anaeramoeba flamelloides TaxID=1746091 RepID=A0AAV8ABJ8_9EUKA|nr:tpr repeat-containing protein [Anaeramoeba flamelloides]
MDDNFEIIKKLNGYLKEKLYQKIQEMCEELTNSNPVLVFFYRGLAAYKRKKYQECILQLTKYFGTLNKNNLGGDDCYSYNLALNTFYCSVYRVLFNVRQEMKVNRYLKKELSINLNKYLRLEILPMEGQPVLTILIYYNRALLYFLQGRYQFSIGSLIKINQKESNKSISCKKQKRKKKKKNTNNRKRKIESLTINKRKRKKKSKDLLRSPIEEIIINIRQAIYSQLRNYNKELIEELILKNITLILLISLKTSKNYTLVIQLIKSLIYNQYQQFSKKIKKHISKLMILLIIIYLKNCDLESAYNEIKKLSTNPSDLIKYLKNYLFYLNFKKIEKKEIHVCISQLSDLSLESSSRTPDVLNLLGCFYYKQKKKMESIRCFRASLQYSKQQKIFHPLYNSCLIQTKLTNSNEVVQQNSLLSDNKSLIGDKNINRNKNGDDSSSSGGNNNNLLLNLLIDFLKSKDLNDFGNERKSVITIDVEEENCMTTKIEGEGEGEGKGEREIERDGGRGRGKGKEKCNHKHEIKQNQKKKQIFQNLNRIEFDQNNFKIQSSLNSELNLNLKYKIAIYYFLLKKWTLALPLYEILEKKRYHLLQNAFSKKFLYEHAYVLLQNGNYEKTLKICDLILKYDPGSGRAHIYKSDALFALNKPAVALKYLQNWIESSNPKFGKYKHSLNIALNNQAVLLANNGKVKQAIKNLKIATKIFPNSIEIFFNFVSLLLSQNKITKACLAWLNFRKVTTNIYDETFKTLYSHLKQFKDPVINKIQVVQRIPKNELLNFDLFILEKWIGINENI